MSPKMLGTSPRMLRMSLPNVENVTQNVEKRRDAQAFCARFVALSGGPLSFLCPLCCVTGRSAIPQRARASRYRSANDEILTRRASSPKLSTSYPKMSTSCNFPKCPTTGPCVEIPNGQRSFCVRYAEMSGGSQAFCARYAELSGGPQAQQSTRMLRMPPRMLGIPPRMLRR